MIGFAFPRGRGGGGTSVEGSPEGGAPNLYHLVETQLTVLKSVYNYF